MLKQEKNWPLIYWNLTTKKRWPGIELSSLGNIQEITEPKYVTETQKKHNEIFENNYMHIVPNRAES